MLAVLVAAEPGTFAGLLRFWGFGLRVSGLGSIGVWGLGVGGLRFRIQGLSGLVRVQSDLLGFRVYEGLSWGASGFRELCFFRLRRRVLWWLWEHNIGHRV